ARHVLAGGLAADAGDGAHLARGAALLDAAGDARPAIAHLARAAQVVAVVDDAVAVVVEPVAALARGLRRLLALERAGLRALLHARGADAELPGRARGAAALTRDARDEVDVVVEVAVGGPVRPRVRRRRDGQVLEVEVVGVGRRRRLVRDGHDPVLGG